MNRLLLTIHNGHWFAEWFGSERERVTELFGTPRLPCPYQSSVPFETVQQSLLARNPGYAVELGQTVQVAELTRLEPLTADIQLSTGRIVKHSPEPNGSQLATPTPGPAEMTEAEWDEYCAVLVADTRATKTVQVAELTR